LAGHYADPTQPIEKARTISRRRRHARRGCGRGGRGVLGPGWAG